MPAPDPSHRRLVWLSRLVLYSLAVGAIALAWHQRHARADDGDDGPDPSAVAFMTGTAGADPARATLADGRVTDLALPLRFHCAPDVGHVWAVYTDLGSPGRGERVRIRVAGSPTTWAHGWYGLAEIAVNGRVAGDDLRATVSAHMALDANGVRADCRTGPVALALDGVGDGPDGATTQAQRVRVGLGRDGRPAKLSVALSLTCDDGHARRVVWATGLDREGRARRGWKAIGGDGELLVGDGDDGTLTGWAQRGADGRVRGGALAEVTLRDGTRCAAPDDVRFDLAPA